MRQLFKGKPNTFQHGTAPPHIHNGMTMFVNRQLPERRFGRVGGPLPGLPDLHTSPASDFFFLRGCEICGLCSANAYNAE